MHLSVSWSPEASVTVSENIRDSPPAATFGETKVGCAAVLLIINQLRYPQRRLNWRMLVLLTMLVLGPVLVRFADWVVASCLRQGVRQVWGILREGGLLAELVAADARAMTLPLIGGQAVEPGDQVVVVGQEGLSDRAMVQIINHPYNTEPISTVNTP